MILPPGVVYHPRQSKLIATNDQNALISIDTKVSGNGGYAITPRDFDESVETCLRGDWDAFDRLYRLDRGTQECPVVLYSRAVHVGNPRLPNITVVPNLRTTETSGLPRSIMALGCTLGTSYSDDDKTSRAQQVYEFQSYGMLLLDRKNGDVDLWVARAGDKLVIPNDCHFSLHNLDEDHPLIALDVVNSRQLPTDDAIAKQLGPMLLSWYDDVEVVFTVNDLYINGLAGVTVAPDVLQQYGREIRLARTTRQDLGSFLYQQFVFNTHLSARFAKYNINVRHAPHDAILSHGAGRDKEQKLFFSRPLAHATTPDTRVYQFFFAQEEPGGDQAVFVPLEPDSVPRPLAPRSESGTPLHRPLVIVVEGAGDWVNEAYRVTFKNRAFKDGRQQLSVFYADDTNWTKGRRPKWAERGAEPSLDLWEVYLDKNDKNDVLRYAALRPDAVFIVTPDSTHSATARSWLNKTPLVFVEKPFDSDIGNVEELQFSLARRPKTEVIGLDHYQYYAAPLHKLQDFISEFLGDALERVDFFLTEARGIEKDRERSLQHGLCLDLLPHCIALLTFFGDVRTIDEISVPHVWQYQPLRSYGKGNENDFKSIKDEFQNETGAMIDFTFREYSGTGSRVPVTAVVGKGFKTEVKYLEVTSRNGRAMRIELRGEPADYRGDYPLNSAFFLVGKGSKEAIDLRDPYDPHRMLHILRNTNGIQGEKLDRERYGSLLDDLLNGTQAAAFSSLSLAQGSHIVRVLDRIWWAVQQSKPWEKPAYRKLDPVRVASERKQSPK